MAGWVVTKPCQLWCGRPVLRRPRRRGPGLRAHHGQRPVPSSNTCASVFQPGTASVTSERQAGAGSLPPPANARQALPRRHRRRSCSTPTIRSRCASPSMYGPYCQYMLDRSGTLRSRRPCFSAACRSRRIRRSSSFRAWPTSWGRRVMGPGGAMPRRAARFVLGCRFRFCARQTRRAQGAGVARRRENRCVVVTPAIGSGARSTADVTGRAWVLVPVSPALPRR